MHHRARIKLFANTNNTSDQASNSNKSQNSDRNLETQKFLNETWEKYRRLQHIYKQSLRGKTRTDRGNSIIILKWKHGLLASGDSHENHPIVSYDWTRSHHTYQHTTRIDFAHSNILSAMNNVEHSRVNNWNIYLPRARVSGSWPAILDAFLASRSRDNLNRKRILKIPFQSFSVTSLANISKL